MSIQYEWRVGFFLKIKSSIMFVCICVMSQSGISPESPRLRIQCLVIRGYVRRYTYQLLISSIFFFIIIIYFSSNFFAGYLKTE